MNIIPIGDGTPEGITEWQITISDEELRKSLYYIARVECKAAMGIDMTMDQYASMFLADLDNSNPNIQEKLKELCKACPLVGGLMVAKRFQLRESIKNQNEHHH